MLWETGRLAPGATARFHTRSGWLTADQRDGLIELDFPATPPTPPPRSSAASPRHVGMPVQWAGRSALRPDGARSADADDGAPGQRPTCALVAALPCRGVIVTAPGDDGKHDFVSRFFGPQSGVDEDPVTGSAHCALAPVLGRAYSAATR